MRLWSNCHLDTVTKTIWTIFRFPEQVIISTTCDALESQILNKCTKFQGRSSFVLEKIFEGLLPYMGVAAILFMWPGVHKQTFLPPSHWSTIWNLALIGQAAVEKTLENGGRRTDWLNDESWLYWKLPVSFRLKWANNRTRSYKTFFNAQLSWAWNFRSYKHKNIK